MDDGYLFDARGQSRPANRHRQPAGARRLRRPQGSHRPRRRLSRQPRAGQTPRQAGQSRRDAGGRAHCQRRGRQRRDRRAGGLGQNYFCRRDCQGGGGGNYNFNLGERSIENYGLD